MIVGFGNPPWSIGWLTNYGCFTVAAGSIGGLLDHGQRNGVCGDS